MVAHYQFTTQSATPAGPFGGFRLGILRAMTAAGRAGGQSKNQPGLATVVNTFPRRERGKALAMFFGIAGGLTAVGPVLGGYLTQWTWRAIFWVNVPVAVTALVLVFVSKPSTEHRASRLSYGEATGITQTVRNYSASLGLAQASRCSPSATAPSSSAS